MLSNIIKLTSSRFAVTLTVRSFSNTSFLSQNITTNLNGSTENAAEISHFRNMVDHWWNEEGEVRLLHSLNTLRVPFVRDCLINKGKLNPEFANSATPLKNLSILDAGCGGGILCEPLAQLGANVTGVDACEELIKCARIHANENKELKNKISYIHSPIEEVAKNNKNKFDAVICSECIEHVNSQEMFLKSCIDILKPGGSFFVSTFNKTYLSWILGVIAAEYILNLVPKGTHDWKKFIPPHEMQKILENNNCQTRVIHGWTYNIVRDKWIWINNTSVNYILHAVKIE